jgi:hypothetical protein
VGVKLVLWQYVREEDRARVLENKVVRRILGAESEEVRGD